MGIILVLLFVWLIWDHNEQNRYRPYPTSQWREDPMELVRKRYANGEITKEQFDQFKQDLR